MIDGRPVAKNLPATEHGAKAGRQTRGVTGPAKRIGDFRPWRMQLREVAIGVAATFALHWLWENAQAFLFKGYAGFAQHLWKCTVGTFGDLAIVAIIYSAVGLLWRDFRWHRRGGLGQHLAAVVVGVGIGALIEYRALATGRWAYDGMPLVPFTAIGLLPILQMAILPPVVFRLMGAVACRKAG